MRRRRIQDRVLSLQYGIAPHGAERSVTRDSVFELRVTDLTAGRRRSSECHDSRQRCIGCRNHRRDLATLAVSDQKEVPAIYVGPRLEISKRSADVIRKIGRRGRSSIAARSAEAPVVHAQNRDPARTECVGYLAERTITNHAWEGLAVLLQS